MSNVVVYSQPGCGPCVQTIRALTDLGVAHDVVDIWEVPSAGQRILDLGFMGTPTIVVTDEYGEVTDAWKGHQYAKLRELAV